MTPKCTFLFVEFYHGVHLWIFFLSFWSALAPFPLCLKGIYYWTMIIYFMSFAWKKPKTVNHSICCRRFFHKLDSLKLPKQMHPVCKHFQGCLPSWAQSVLAERRLAGRPSLLPMATCEWNTSGYWGAFSSSQPRCGKQQNLPPHTTLQKVLVSQMPFIIGAQLPSTGNAGQFTKKNILIIRKSKR